MLPLSSSSRKVPQVGPSAAVPAASSSSGGCLPSRLLQCPHHLRLPPLPAADFTMLGRRLMPLSSKDDCFSRQKVKPSDACSAPARLASANCLSLSRRRFLHFAYSQTRTLAPLMQQESRRETMSSTSSAGTCVRLTPVSATTPVVARLPCNGS